MSCGSQILSQDYLAWRLCAAWRSGYRASVPTLLQNSLFAA